MTDLDPSAFRARFPALAATPTDQLTQTYCTAGVYITRSNRCGGMTPAQRAQALDLMTAHLLYLNDLVVQGSTPGITTAATVDKVSVTLQPPPETNQWAYWLNQSPYGQQLLALLQVASIGGFYASTAVPGRAGFWFGNGM